MNKAGLWLAAAMTFLLATPQAWAQSETLSAFDIRNGMNAVRANIMACSRHVTGPPITVTMRVSVAPTGFVMSATSIRPSVYHRLDSCASAAIMQTRFPATARGHIFNYPIPYSRLRATPVMQRRPTTQQVRAGVRAIRWRFQACAPHMGVPGPVRLSVRFRIKPDGSVGRARVNDGNWRLRRCVRDALKTAVFPASVMGDRVSRTVKVRGLPPRRACRADGDCGAGNYCRTDEYRRSICMQPL